MVNGISSLFTEKKLDDATLEELEDLLITSDLGVAAASEMTRNLAAKKFNNNIILILFDIIFEIELLIYISIF